MVLSAWAATSAIQTEKLLLTSIALLIVGLDARTLETDRRLSKALDEIKTVGFSVAVFENGKRAYSKGFGYENRDAKKPASPKTVYRLGSISKSVTAVAVMNWWQQGKIDIDADIRSYVPAFPEKPWKVTARQIMSHTSGIRHYTPNERPVYRHYRTAADAIELFGNDPLLFEPGARYSYSTHAWTVLAAACEKVSGQTFPAFLRKAVLDSVGPAIGCEDLNSANNKRTDLYQLQGGKLVESTPREDNSWKYAGGGLESDVETLARFGTLLLDNKLISESTRKVMWTPVENKAGIKSDYGLGFRIADGTVGHSGAQQGCRTNLLIDPERRIVIVIMTNTGGGPSLGPISNDILRIWRSSNSPKSVRSNDFNQVAIANGHQ